MFFLEYLKHPRRIGAVAPSGRQLALCMMEPIDFEKAETIVEYGPGTGAFTEELFSRKRPETRLILIEQNPAFHKSVSETYHGKNNTTVLLDTAERADEILKEHGLGHADYIVSGLPFTSLPERVTQSVFAATKNLMGSDGVFITFQYSKVKQALFESRFTITDCLRAQHNVPPAYVYVMKNKE